MKTPQTAARLATLPPQTSPPLPRRYYSPFLLHHFPPPLLLLLLLLLLLPQFILHFEQQLLYNLLSFLFFYFPLPAQKLGWKHLPYRTLAWKIGVAWKSDESSTLPPLKKTCWFCGGWRQTGGRKGGSEGATKKKREKSLHSSLSRRLLEKRKKRKRLNGMTHLFACYLRGGTLLWRLQRRSTPVSLEGFCQ